MKYRFQIVSSNYHKGRLRIAYDPNFFGVDTEYNVNYMHVVDIAEKNDFTVSVTNGQQVSLIDHHIPGPDSATQLYSATRYTNEEEGNGVIQVSILNELTVPNSTVNNDIQINVFVSTGDDFEVFVPDDVFQYYTFTTQSGLEPQSGVEVTDSTKLDSSPVGENADLLNGSMDTPSSLNMVYTGESIKNFRTLLKRYNLHYGYSARGGGHLVASMSNNTYPFLRGYVAGAIHLTNALASYNYCNTLLLHWITYAFSGWRGSLRYKYLPRGGWNHLTTMVERGGIRQGGQSTFSIGLPENPTSNSEAASETVARNGNTPINDRPLSGKKGLVYAVQQVNPCVEVEFPFYSDARFVPGRVGNWNSTAATSRYNECYDYRAWIDSNESSESYVDMYCAAGEDFQVYFFKGLPRIYYEPVPPIPSTVPD